jgi:hypothetical protein
MKRTVVALALASSLLTGCFTVIGGVAGASIGEKNRISDIKKQQRGESTPERGNAFGRGLLVGLAVDTILAGLVVSAAMNDGPMHGPDL